MRRGRPFSWLKALFFQPKRALDLTRLRVWPKSRGVWGARLPALFGLKAGQFFTCPLISLFSLSFLRLPFLRSNSFYGMILNTLRIQEFRNSGIQELVCPETGKIILNFTSLVCSIWKTYGFTGFEIAPEAPSGPAGSLNAALWR
jgi:hypothetical protein